MRRYEFKDYVESALNRSKFEEIALKKIRAEYVENGSKKKELTEVEESRIVNQMWERLIDTAYQKVKELVKSNNVEAWKLKIEELNLVEELNNSFEEY